MSIRQASSILRSAALLIPARFPGWIVRRSQTTYSREPITVNSKCVGCEGIGSAMPKEQVEQQRALLIPEWQLNEQGTRLSRTLLLKDFPTAIHYINQVARIAEAEQHHPDLTIREYNHVDITLWTHALGGVTENDLIMAVKIDTVPAPPSQK